MFRNSPSNYLNSDFSTNKTDQENKRITLKIYNEGLKLMDGDNQQLVGEIANYFIPRAREDVVKVSKYLSLLKYIFSD